MVWDKMVHDTEYITFRAMQNPDEPDLPFAQSLLPTMFRDMQNPDEPDLPFAQSARPSGKYVYYEYIVNGDSWVYGKKVNEKVVLRETTAIQWRMYGYTVEKVSQTTLDAGGNPTGTSGGSSGGTTSNGHSHVFETLHPKQTQQLIKIGVDTTKLGKDTTELGKKLTEAKIERDRIEAKVNATKAEHQDFHNKLEAIGQALTQHNVGHDVGGGIFGGGMIALAVIGVGAYFLLRRKK